MQSRLEPDYLSFRVPHGAEAEGNMFQHECMFVRRSSTTLPVDILTTLHISILYARRIVQTIELDIM